MLLVINGQRNRTHTAVLVQRPGHSMDGECTKRPIDSSVLLALCFAILSLHGGNLPVEDGFHGGTAHGLLAVCF